MSTASANTTNPYETKNKNDDNSSSSSSSSAAMMHKPNPHLDRILQKLRPFQREAFDFAVNGRISSRQWSNVTSNDQKNNRKCSSSTKPPSHPVDYQSEDLLGKGRILLCDEMGLGKTISSLAIMTNYYDEWPLLILCPASLRYTWPGEIEKFLPGIPSSAVYVMQGFDDADVYENTSKRNKIKIVVATYSLLQNRSAAARCLDQFNFRCVIVDESHNLKQRNSQRTNLALPLLQKANRLVLLSGTPALARPVELWTQVYSIAPKLFGKYTPFTIRYCDAKRDRFGWNVKGLSHAEELHSKLKQVMVRRLKADVLHELPAKVRSIVPIQLPKGSKRTECISLMKELYETRQSIADLVGEDANGAHFEARRLLNQAYQASGIAKADACCDYIVDWLRGSASHQKVLIFAHHAAVMDSIENAVSKELKGAGHIRIDGSVSAHDRAMRVRKFQTSSQVRVAVLSMTAAGVGLTLTAASTVIFTELHWTPGVLGQCEDRSHRIGQANSVNVSYLICEDPEMSIDSQLWQMLSRKVSSLGRVIDGQRGVGLDAKRDADGLSETNDTSTGMSVQDELSTFFAEASTSKQSNNRAPAAGSILNFFSKKDKTSENENEGSTDATTASMRTPSSKQASGRLVEWNCPACTFYNSRRTIHKSSLACSMCGTLHDATETGVVTPGYTQSSPTDSLNIARHHSGLKRSRETEMIVIDNDDDDNDNSTILPQERRARKKFAKGDSSSPIVLDCDTDNIRNDRRAGNDGQKISFEQCIEPSHNQVNPTMSSTDVDAKDNFLTFAVSRNSEMIMIHYQSTGEASLVNFEISSVLTNGCWDLIMEAKLSRKESKQVHELEFDESQVRKLAKRLDYSQIQCNSCPHGDLERALVSEIQAFVKQYMSLREVEKKFVQTAESQFSSTTDLKRQVLRQMSVVDNGAKPTHITSRYVGGAKERARENVANGTASNIDEEILEGRRCAYCGERMSSAALRRWDGVRSTYCSRECAEAGRIKRGGMYASTNIRQQLFALEGGVCQICNIDAHAVYTNVVALQPSERLNALLKARWRLPKTKQGLDRLLVGKPDEGNFWQADHIHAVSEGGGGCDISNFRTLCVPCHTMETAKLQSRLKLMPGGSPTNDDGSNSNSSTQRQPDIRSMFAVMNSNSQEQQTYHHQQK